MNLNENLTYKGNLVKKASRELARMNTGLKNQALLAIAEEIDQNREVIKAENSKDVAAGKRKGPVSCLYRPADPG